MSNVRAAPLDPALFAPSSAAVPSPSAARAAVAMSQAESSPNSVLKKGQDIWYRHRSGVWMEGRVTLVDLSLDPPSYQVETKSDGMVRDTERPRIKPRLAGEPPPPSDISVLQSAAAPAPQATSPPAASSAPAAMAPGATAAAPGGDAGQPAHPSWATNTHQAADVQAPPTGVPAGPQPAGHVHGAWYGQYPQAPSELPAHQRQPLGTNGERPGQPPAAQPHPGQPVTMPHHSHLPPGVQPQGFSPQGYYHQGYVPQYPPHGHFHTGVPQSAQWPQAQSIAAGNPMGGHIPGCGWYPNMSNVQSPNGAQPRPHGTHGWGAHPGGHPIPAPGGSDRSHMWQPLQHNANMMQTHHGWSSHPRGHPVPAPAGGDRSQPWNPLAHNANSMQPQQPSGYNMSMVNPQGQYHGGSGPQGNAASPGHDTGTRTTDDMFRGMQIRQ